MSSPRYDRSPRRSVGCSHGSYDDKSDHERRRDDDNYRSRRGDYDSPSPPRRYNYTDRCTSRSWSKGEHAYGRVQRNSMSPPPKHLQRTSSPERPSLREKLCFRKYVELEQYQKDYADGKYAHLSRADKVRMFGSPHMPVLVPLAPRELPEEYEDRFKKWLARIGMPFEKLQRHNPFEERVYRIKFSNANALGSERFEPVKKRDRPPSNKGVDDEHSRNVRPKTIAEYGADTSKSANNSKMRSITRLDRCRVQLPMCDASPVYKIGAYVACGCSNCLFGAMGLMAERIKAMDEFQMAMLSTPSVMSNGLEEGEIVEIVEIVDLL